MATAQAFVGLGANLGDAPATLRQALAELAQLPQTAVVTASSLYCSAPVEASGPPYVNAVAELATMLSPLDLLRALQSIEQAHGRQRPYLNAPRSLDLDLLLHGQSVYSDAVLTLPHPRGHQRGFVLVPLCEIAPDLVWPSHGRVAELAMGITDQAIVRLAP